MEKKVYNRPFMKQEAFVPNEYVATCWYIAEGDCYNGLIIRDHDDVYKNNDNRDDLDLSGHGSHRVPASGYFRTDGGTPVAMPTAQTPTGTYSYWYYGGTGNPTNNKPWTTAGYTRITSYYYFKDANNTEHYFKKVTEASKPNAIS